MRPFSQSYRPVERTRISLGQFSPFINPFEVTGESTPMTPPSATPAPGPYKTGIILGGLAMTALSAATAYVGISYGMDKHKKDLQRALGWTVGVIGALSGLVRMAVTTGVMFMDVPAPRTLAGRKV